MPWLVVPQGHEVLDIPVSGKEERVGAGVGESLKEGTGEDWEVG